MAIISKFSNSTIFINQFPFFVSDSQVTLKMDGPSSIEIEKSPEIIVNYSTDEIGETEYTTPINFDQNTGFFVSYKIENPITNGYVIFKDTFDNSIIKQINFEVVNGN